ncbi:hypothetical protein [Muriicola sp.]|uniref:hypothetical protein n=1 Tax=Muriicola sp. TaxID=2020856 RepID=UPI003C720340
MMETNNLEKAAATTQKLQLINGEFTPSEASEVLLALIDEKINFHKIKRLQLWEGDHKYETSHMDSRIAELKEEKRIASEFITNIKASGKNLKINGIVEISVID